MDNHMIRLMSNWQETYDVLLLAHSEVMTLKAADERVRELHKPEDKWGSIQCGYCYDLNWSYEGLDSQDTSFPCDTIKALDGETDG